MFDGEPIFEPPNPHPSPLEIQVGVPHPDGFADSQAVAIHHEQEQIISQAVATFLRRFKESVHFGIAEEILRAFVPVCQLDIFTFYLVAAWARGFTSSQTRMVVDPLARDS